ncbi:MAG: hypothetical protein IKV57_01065 [Clostridia bacterium]|nr:hypothetical protein [Clostridia bacterium]
MNKIGGRAGKSTAKKPFDRNGINPKAADVPFGTRRQDRYFIECAGCIRRTMPA